MGLVFILLFLLLVTTVDADCQNGVLACLRTFQSNVEAHGSDRTKLCQDIDQYIQCFFSQGCPVSESDKQKLIYEQSAQVERLNCPFKFSDLIYRYGNGSSLISTMAPTDNQLKCKNLVDLCTEDLKQSIQRHTGNFKLLCEDIEIYIHCAFNKNCKISEAEKDLIIEGFGSQIDSYGCPFKWKDLINSNYYNNNNTASQATWKSGSLMIVLFAVLLMLL
ncbi:uncharacterized protein LOC106058653 [Biomphalaria glabrata]|uniref:Uncharacterized protein LOC106058653 n=1 Tax=Biomphalaria glabrata TaxID=6526 RepID=A0A9W3A9A9_BIOGL|nr:uncharacterized protein LOC106058653 [Biomphalaria glabrata]